MTTPTQAPIDWPDPTPEMLASPQFKAIWRCIKHWDIIVPDAYQGYCRATGNHVRSILDALAASQVGYGEPQGIGFQADLCEPNTAQVRELKPSALWARSEYLDTVEADKREAAAQVGEPEIEKLKHDIERYMQIANDASRS